MQTKRRGFTLFELVLVVAILLITGATVMPMMQTLWGATPINAAADTIKARMAQARARAMAENRPYRFDAMDNSGTMRVAPDSAEFWDNGASDGSTVPPTDNNSGPAPLVVDDQLPKDIRFCGSQSAGTTDAQPQAGNSGSGNWVCPVVFLPDGTTRQDAEIAFTDGNGKPLVLRVQAATGAITTAPR